MIVLEQPKKAIVSLIIVNSLPDTITHNRLEELRKISDLIFLFGDVDVDPEKFTSLYQGCGYVTKKKMSIVEMLRFSMEYCLEIFNTHITYLICPNLEDLGREDINFESLYKVSLGDLTYPIFKDRRLKCDEFKEIYTPKYGWLGNIVENDYGKYSSHITLSPIIMIKGKVVRVLLELSTNIWRTFLNNPSLWIASIFERNGVKHINENPWNEDLQTKRE